MASQNRIYGGTKTSSQNSTSPLITRGQQLLLSSNEEDEEDSEPTQNAVRASRLEGSNIVPGQSNTLRTNRALNGSLYQLDRNSDLVEQDSHYYYEPIVANRLSNERRVNSSITPALPPPPPERTFTRPHQSSAYGTLNNTTDFNNMRSAMYGTSVYGQASPAYVSHVYNSLNHPRATLQTSKRRTKC